MGLMRAVLKSANLERVNARGADLSRVDLEFASLRGGRSDRGFSEERPTRGSRPDGATVGDADFDGADLTSTKLIAPRGLDLARKSRQGEKSRPSDQAMTAPVPLMSMAFTNVPSRRVVR